MFGKSLIRGSLALSMLLSSTGAAIGVIIAASTSASAASSPLWTKLKAGSTTNTPEKRTGASAAYDQTTGQIILFGGYGTSGYLGTTWAFKTGKWTKLKTGTTTATPARREDASMAYDQTTGQIILFGGYGTSAFLGTTWAFKTGKWTKLKTGTTTATPEKRTGASAAYDQTTGQIILFGGYGYTGLFGTTWAFKNGTWTELTTGPNTPEKRTGASMAYDQTTGQIILFGGSTITRDFLGTTWAFKTGRWTKLKTGTIPTTPVKRYDASAAYDQATKEIILFGGYGTSAFLGTTWAFKTGTWTKLKAGSTTTTPGKRAGASASYDQTTKETILFGGYTTSSGALGTTWAFGAEVPSAPTEPTAVAGTKRATVTWSAPTPGASAITGYTVTSTPGTKTCSTTGTSTTCTVLGLTNGTTYTFSVRAKNAHGTGATSPPSVAVKPSATPTITVSSSKHTSVAGQGITYLLTAHGQVTATPAPSGRVAFYATTSVITGCTSIRLSSSGTGDATAQCRPTPKTLTVGTYSIYGVFTTSNTTYTNKTSSIFTQKVLQNTPKVTISLTPSATVANGATVKITATIKAGSNGKITPLAKVDFQETGSTITGCRSVSPTQYGTGQATATCTSKTLVTGTLTAKYLGTATFKTATSAGVALTVVRAKATPHVTETLSQTTVTYGAETVLRVNVVVTGSGVVPSGTATVTAATTVLCIATIVTGKGSCSPTASAANSPTFTSYYTVHASYTPGSTPHFVPAVSATSSLFVEKAATVTKITVAPTSAAYGNEKAVNLSSTVTAAGPTVTGGTISFYATGTPSTVVCTATVSDGVANCSPTTETLATVGTYVISGKYEGSLDFKTSTLVNTVTATVTPDPVTVSVATSPASVIYGTEPTSLFSWKATPKYAALGAKYTVTIYVDTTPVCTKTNANPTTTCVTSAWEVKPGTYTVSATFSVTTTFSLNSSTAVAPRKLTVAKSEVTLSGTASATSAPYGTESSLDYTGLSVVPNPTGTGSTPRSAVPTGTITITAQKTSATYTLCSIPVSTTHCSPSSKALPAGTYDVTETYSGDAIYLPASRSLGTITITKTKPTVSLTLTPSSRSVDYGTETKAVFHVVVSSSNGTPSGTVFVDGLVTGTGPQPLCTINLVTGKGACSPSATEFSPALISTIVATYPSGTSNFSGAISVTTTLTIAVAQTTTATSVSPQTVVYGDETTVAYSATVSAPGLTVTGGTVYFYAERAYPYMGTTQTMCSATVVDGKATCSTTRHNDARLTATPAPYDIFAHFTPTSSNVTGSITTSVARLTSQIAAHLTVTPDPVTFSISTITDSTTYGSESTSLFSWRVTPEYHPFTFGVTFNVTIYAGQTEICTAYGIEGTCTTTYSPWAVKPGTYTVTATFSNTTSFLFPNFTPTSGTATAPHLLVVNKATSAVSFASSTTSGVYGQEQNLSFTPSVTPTRRGTHTGTTTGTPKAVRPSGTTTITATKTGKSYLLCTSTASSTGTHSWTPCSPTPRALAQGTYTLHLSYSGDDNYLSSLGLGTTLTILAPATSVKLTVSLKPSSVDYGQETKVVFSATVEPPSTVSGPVTGTVSFAVGSTPLCTATLGTGKASCSPTTSTALGATASTYVVTATYSNTSGNFASGTTNTTARLYVKKAPSTSNLQITPATVTYGNESTATLQVQVTSQTSGFPTGTVKVYDGSVHVCTASLITASGESLPPSTTLYSCKLGTTTFLPGTYALHAIFETSLNFLGSKSTSETLTVIKDATGTDLTVTDTTVTYGTESTTSFYVTVFSLTSPNTASPTGTVDIEATNNGAQDTLCAIHITATDVCSPSKTALDASTTLYAITAHYLGSTGFDPSTSTVENLRVQKASTPTVHLAESQTTLTYGNEEAVVFSGTVVAPTTGKGVPSGTAKVLITGQLACTMTLVAGKGTCSPAPTAVLATPTNPRSAVLSYSGDVNLPPATSATLNLTIKAEPTSGKLTLSGTSVSYGDLTAVAFSVVVSPKYEGTPKGSVTVDEVAGHSTKVLCSIPAPTLTSGSGTCLATNPLALTASSYPYAIEALYTSDTPNFVSSTSPETPLTVGKAPSKLSAASAPTSVTYGNEKTVVFSTKVTALYAGVPEGRVHFVASTANGLTTSLCVGTLVTQKASCSVSSGTALPALANTGNYTITAIFEGDTDFGTSQSLPATLQVKKATSALSLTAQSEPYGSEAKAVFGVTVSPEYPFGGTPSGTVTLTTSKGTPVCSVSLVTAKGTCSLTNNEEFQVGTITLDATYAGDTNFLSSKATTPTSITRGPTATTITPSANPSLPSHQVTLSVKVTGVDGSPTPSGTVTISDGKTVLCSGLKVVGATNSRGTASCGVYLPSTTSQSIVATYSGDATHLGSFGTEKQKVLHGYYEVAADGGVFTFGNAVFYGSKAGKHLSAHMVGIAPTANGKGYWTVAADGGIFTYGNARFYGSTGKRHLRSKIIGMETAPNGKGYWLLSSNGSVFAFGSARFFGSVAAKKISGHIVGLVANETGKGYWEVASSGAVYAFGNASHIKAAKLHTKSPIVGLAPMPTGKGYFLATKAGQVYAFGTARTHGSLNPKFAGAAIVAIGSTSDGKGYWLVSSKGVVFSFGDAITDKSLQPGLTTSPITGFSDL